jgi:large subunit ribosomal protein L28
MSRRCEITGKGPQVGNSVSHANNKTKRRFLPNLQDVSFFSVGLKKNIKVSATTHGIRTVEHKGGIDAFLLGTAPTKLNPVLRKLRKQLIEKQGTPAKPVAKKRRAVSPAKAVKKAKKAAKRAAPKKKAA